MADDSTDGDRLLNLFGAAVALFILAGIVGVVLAGLGGPSDDTETAPEVDWSLQRLNESHVQLTHNGGDPVPASDLVVTADGVRRRVSWDGLVTDGDSGVVRADRGLLVQLYWTTERGERVKLREWANA